MTQTQPNWWWRLENSKRELLGQLLLPSDAFREGHYSHAFHMTDRMPISWDMRENLPDSVTLTTVALHRAYGNVLEISFGTLEQLENVPQVRFFPSYGLTSGKVSP